MADSQPQTVTQPSQSTSPETQRLPEIIGAYCPLRAFKGSKPESSYHVTSLDFDDQGEFLVSSGEDDAIQVFDIKEGTVTKTVPCKKYGAHLARFTHHQRQLLHASTKVDHNLRLLDLHGESYIRYFTHHTDTVTSLAVAPSGDHFVSVGKDNTVTVWDLASRNPQGKLKLATPYLVNFDPSASVLAIASQSTSSVLLYDFRNYDKAPFATFDLAPFEELYTPTTRGRAWTRLEFSNDGKYLMVGTDYHGHYILDAFDGSIQAFLAGKSGPSGRAAPVSTTGKARGQGDACFTPDGRYVIGGNGDDPSMLIWDVQQKREANNVLYPLHKLPSKCRTAVVEYNPRYNMIATADKETVFWLPDEAKSSEK